STEKVFEQHRSVFFHKSSCILAIYKDIYIELTKISTAITTQKYKAEKRSYHRYRHLYGIKSSEHQGRQRIYDITLDPSKTLVDQVDDIINQYYQSYEDGTYQYSAIHKKIYNILYSQKRSASKKINTINNHGI
ncbi:MAG: hypothetical protein LKI46_05140, partial [Prevotella sp.]